MTVRPMYKRSLSVGLFFLLCGATAAQESFYQRHFAPPCYTRSYDEAHLAAHPRQRVTGFYMTSNGPDGLDSQSFIVDFGFTVKGKAFPFYSSAACDSIPDAAQCWVDGDGGTFTLQGIDGGLEIRIGDSLVVEGRTDFSPDLGQGGDDKIIRVFASPPAACG